MRNTQTLNEYQRILSLGDVIYTVDFPLGTSVFAKDGSIDLPGFHCLCVPGACASLVPVRPWCLCVPGGMFFNDRRVYFCFNINWYAEAKADPTTVTAFLAAVNQAVDVVDKGLFIS